MTQTNGDLPSDPHLTSLAIAYRNPDKVLVADSVLPRDDSLAETLFSYQRAKDVGQQFRLPHTAVGPKGKVNRLELDWESVPAQTEDNAIDVPLSFYDTKRKNARDIAAGLATSIIQLRHEFNVAQLVFNAASYVTGQKEELEGDERLDHADYEGNPLELVDEALGKMLLRGNIAVFGQASWRKFRTNPKVVSAVLGNAGTSGLVTPAQVAAVLGLQEILVGEGWLNTSLPGVASNMVQVWGPHIALIHRDRNASTQGGVTFGLTAQYGTRIAGWREEKDMGMRGGQIVRVGESTKPLIVAPYGGYFIENAVGNG